MGHRTPRSVVIAPVYSHWSEWENLRRERNKAKEFFSGREVSRREHYLWCLEPGKWFLFSEGQVFGSFKQTENGGQAFLDNVLIYERFRGLGLGKVLVETSLKMAKDKPVVLKVKAPNIRAFLLYQSLGFETVSVDDGWIQMERRK